MKPEFPIKISYQKFKEFVYVAGGMPFKPTAYFPTMEDIIDHLETTDNKPERKAEDDLKYLIWNLIFGFDRDKDWHKENPGCSERSVSNLIKYIFRPVIHNDGNPHTNIWNEDDDESVIIDKESGFDYIQDKLTDKKTIQFDIDENIDEDLYYEILVRQSLKDDVKEFDLTNGRIVVNFKKSAERESLSADDFYTLYYFIA